jgi:hypothetical protein
VTIDEELTQLDDNIRRLKIEYDIFFGGGNKKPPADLEWRVQQTIKRYADGHKMSFPQKFRYNSISQKYALYNSLWQQKAKIKEEGYRRPQDAVLGIAGMRIDQEQEAKQALSGHGKEASAEEEKAFRTAVSDPGAEHENVERLYKAMMAAKAKAGEQGAANFDSFKTFVQKKTEQLRKDFGCHAVEYSVEMENGQVKLKAKAKV